ncbi:response regulator [Dyadobacter sp. 3J3]|uniref:response regulator n=1 Tax=Dyadobacter sp. 3J3 TaxID=2606600 RepID=UPI00135955C4|nr:response regulator [Dyadobacter sp. 3J3]
MACIAIIDKHPIFRKGLTLFLSSSFREVSFTETDSLERFYRSYPATKPDLVVIGVDLRSHSYPLQIRWIKHQYRPVKILVMYDGISDAPTEAKFINVGVDKYISKQENLENLYSTIWKLLNPVF